MYIYILVVKGFFLIIIVQFCSIKNILFAYVRLLCIMTILFVSSYKILFNKNKHLIIYIYMLLLCIMTILLFDFVQKNIIICVCYYVGL